MSVKNRPVFAAEKIGVRKQRKCLRCAKMFDSWSAANRVCKKCTEVNREIDVGFDDKVQSNANLRNL